MKAVHRLRTHNYPNFPLWVRLFLRMFIAIFALINANNASAEPEKDDSTITVETKELVILDSVQGEVVLRNGPVKRVKSVDAHGLPILDSPETGTPGTVSITVPAEQAEFAPNLAASPNQKAQSLAAPILIPTLDNPDFEQGAANNKAANWAVCSGDYTRVLLSSNDGFPNNLYAIGLTAANRTSVVSACQTLQLNQVDQNPVFVGAQVRGTNVTSGTGSGAYLLARFLKRDGSTVICGTLPNTGTFGWRWIGLNSDTCGIDQPIVNVQVELRLDEASGTAYFDLTQLAQFVPTRGAATIQFDDSQVTDWIPAKDIVSGPFKGSSAYSSDDRQNLPSGREMTGLMTPEQVRSLHLDYQWDILSHGVHHYKLTDLSLADAEAELRDSQTAINAILGDNSVVDVAYPYGPFNQDIVGIAQKYYRSGRGTAFGYNPAGTFPWDVHVYGIYNGTSISDIRVALQQACRTRKWVILQMHMIDSILPGTYLWANTPDFLRQLVQEVQTESLTCPNGFDVITYREGIETFGATPSGGAQIPNAVTVSNPGPQRSTVGVAILPLQISATDSSGDSLSFSATGLPTGLSLNSSGLITGTPSVSGTFAVTVTAGNNQGGTGSASFTWTVTSAASGNLAFNKPAVASSVETSAFPPGMAVDGNVRTRWSSAYNDAEWLQVDLGAIYSINRVRLIWEAAYGRSYQIQASPDASTWTTLYTRTAGAGGTEDLTNLQGTGRYVRMLGVQRGTVWGYSLWEMEVYGGLTTGVAVTSPGSQSTAVGSPVSLQIAAMDSNSAPLPLSYSATGLPAGLSINSATGLISGTPTTVGTFSTTVTASNAHGSASTSFTWTVTSAASGNLAFNKPAVASSVETSAFPPGMAVDGNVRTRWSSAYNDAEWLQVDLGAIYSINRVRLIWEAAYGRSYQIQVSPDASTWTTLYTRTAGAGGTEDLTNLQGTGRYVRMLGVQRGTVWGYSLWEMEVYGN